MPTYLRYVVGTEPRRCEVQPNCTLSRIAHRSNDFPSPPHDGPTFAWDCGTVFELILRTVNYATHKVLALLLLVACKEPSSQRTETTPLGAAESLAPAPVRRATVDSLEQLPETRRVVTKAIMPNGPEQDPGCSEYIDGNTSGMRSVRYLKPAELAAHHEKITDELPSLWDMAEQGAPVSIADDFEHGISTENRYMPDTLSAEVWIYAKCTDRKPYVVLHYGIWRTAEEGYAWRRR